MGTLDKFKVPEKEKAEVLTVSPFYHFNRAHYTGEYTGQVNQDVFTPEDDRGSNYKWLTLNGGVRLTHFGGTGTNTLLGGNHPISENASDPRLGAAVQIPKLHWVARAFWGRYYQAPPLLTVSGPLLAQSTPWTAGFCPCTASATSNASSASRFPSRAGPLTSPISARPPETSSIMTFWEIPTSSSH
jgi:hypothetical protein